MVTKSDAPKLLDVMTRHQIYLEAVKAEYGGEFDAVAQQLRRDIREIFLDLEDVELSALTKRQLERFIKRLKAAQTARFSVYTQQVLNDLRKFTQTETEVSVEIMRETQERDSKALSALALLLAAKGANKLWARILNAPLQASGALPEDYLRYFATGAVVNFENTVRRAHANKMKTREALAALLGTSRLNNRDGQLYRLYAQADGVIATLFQHASGIVQEEVAVLYFDEYQWVSILDSQTSDICRERHGNVYRYGDGPLPPAHPRCRSKTVPVDRDRISQPPTYYGWMKQQPYAVQRDILGEAGANGLREGSLTSANLTRFVNTSKLTLPKFKDKLKLILAI